MGVKAIFYVNEVTDTASGSGKVKLNAVAKGPYANWSKYTPSGEINIVSLNPAATEWYRERVGKDVTVEFRDPTEADLIS